MEEIKQLIKEKIATNGKGAITAEVLQNVLLEIVDEVSAECGSLGTSVDELLGNVTAKADDNAEAIQLINDKLDVEIGEKIQALEESDTSQSKSIETLEKDVALLDEQLTQLSATTETKNNEQDGKISEIETQIGNIDEVLTNILGEEA